MANNEVCYGCKLEFKSYDRKIQTIVDNKLRSFHPNCFSNERSQRMQEQPKKVEGTRMSRDRGKKR